MTQPTHTTTEVSEDDLAAIREFAIARSPYKITTFAHKLFVDAVCTVSKAWIDERAALSPRDGVPGMVLVPREPTDEMLAPFCGLNLHRDTKAYISWAYKTMLDRLSTASSSGRETP